MNKLIAILFPFLLTGCITAKVSHKSEVKADIVTNNKKQTAAKTDDQKETHVRETTIDTVYVTREAQAEYRVQWIHDTAYLDKHKHDKPIQKTVAIGKGSVRAIFYPATGYFDISANIPPDTIKIQADVKETAISEHKTSNIDSSTNKKKNVKTDVKGGTSVTVSLFSMNYLWAIGGLLIGLIAGRIIWKNKTTSKYTS